MSRGDGIVCLEFLHGPDDQPQGGDRSLGQFKLVQKVARHAGTGLISGEKPVPEGFDDMVKRTGDVSHVLVTEQDQERLYKPSYGTYGVSVRRRKRWKCVVGPEEFVRSIDQVDFQMFFSSRRRSVLQSGPFKSVPVGLVHNVPQRPTLVEAHAVVQEQFRPPVTDVRA